MSLAAQQAAVELALLQLINTPERKRDEAWRTAWCDAIRSATSVVAQSSRIERARDVTPTS